MSDDFPDLFGAIEPPKRGRGRPEHVPTRENRRKVERLLIAGCPKVQIARAIGVTMPTFRLHYLRNLRKKNGNKIESHED
jgi:hypothetical protein